MEILFNGTTYPKIPEYKALEAHVKDLVGASFRDSAGRLHLTILQKSREIGTTGVDCYDVLVDFKYLRCIAAIQEKVGEIQVHLVTEDVLRKIKCIRLTVLLGGSNEGQNESDANAGIPIGTHLYISELASEMQEEMHSQAGSDLWQLSSENSKKRRAFYEDMNEISNLFAMIVYHMCKGMDFTTYLYELKFGLDNFFQKYIKSKNLELIKAGNAGSFVQSVNSYSRIEGEFQGGQPLGKLQELYAIFGEMVRLGIERL